MFESYVWAKAFKPDHRLAIGYKLDSVLNNDTHILDQFGTYSYSSHLPLAGYRELN